MDLHYLRLFNVLASELSFSKTASALYISQPAVSIQIKKLETDLGIKLFDKVGKNIHLNENGKILFEYTKQIFALIEEARTKLHDCNNVVKGFLSIGASSTPGTYILPEIISHFRKAYPQVFTNLQIGSACQMEKILLDNKVDFILTGGDAMCNDQVFTEKLYMDEIIFIASPQNKLTDMEYIEPEQMMGMSYVTHEPNSYLYRCMENIMAEINVPFNVVMTMGCIDTIKQAVLADIGISSVPLSAVRTELRYGILKRINVKGRSWEFPYNISYLKNKHMTPAATNLINMIRNTLKGPILNSI